MGESNSLHERIAGQDKSIPSPNQRAEIVWKFIRENKPEWTDWDLLCFAIEFTGYMSANLQWLNPEIKSLAKLLYQAHYFLDDKQQLRSGIISEHQIDETRGGTGSV